HKKIFFPSVFPSLNSPPRLRIAFLWPAPPPHHMLFGCPSQGKMIMGRFVCFASFMVVCLLIFSPSILADGVHSFTDRADSFFDSSIHFTDADSASVDGHSFFESRTFGSTQHHVYWLPSFYHHHLHPSFS